MGVHAKGGGARMWFRAGRFYDKTELLISSFFNFPQFVIFFKVVGKPKNGSLTVPVYLSGGAVFIHFRYQSVPRDYFVS